MQAKQNKALNTELKMSVRSFMTSLIILVTVVVLVGVLTYTVTPGQFDYVKNEQGKLEIVPGTWTEVDASDTNRVPIYRWLTIPIEAVIFANGNFTIIQVCAMLLVLGGSFFIIENTGGMKAMIIQLVDIFKSRKYLGVWTITAFIMIMSSVFGLQEHFLILFPIIMGLCVAMNWDNMIAISMILLTSGVGFTVAISNPFTIGTASTVMGTNIMSGVVFRIVCLVIFFVVTALILVKMAKNTERARMAEGLDSSTLDQSMIATAETRRIATMYISLFVGVLVVMIVASAIPATSGLTMLFMAGGFLIGTFVMGTKITKDFKMTLRSFGKGAVALAPSVLLVLLAYSVKYLAEEAMIMDTLFNEMFGLFHGQNPYVTIVLLYFVILLLEFFIPSGSSKAILIMPLLASMPIEGMTPQLMILIYLFADGFTNVFFPTCATLIVGLSLANVSYGQWFKKTWWFQILMIIISILVLFVAYAIGYPVI